MDDNSSAQVIPKVVGSTVDEVRASVNDEFGSGIISNWTCKLESNNLRYEDIFPKIYIKKIRIKSL